MAVPSVAECLGLMDAYRMPEHIRRHSTMVARVAEVLARELRQRGAAIDVELTLAGGLLHDIAKVLCIENDCSHAELGREICNRHGFAEVGPLVAEHVMLASAEADHLPNGPGGDRSARPCCNERELVYYADKRVNHDRVVTLEQRRDDIIRRYAPNHPGRQEQIRENFARCRQLESLIFNQLDFGPDQLAQRLGDESAWPTATTTAVKIQAETP